MSLETKSTHIIFLKADNSNAPAMWATIRLSRQILCRLIELDQILKAHRLASVTASIEVSWQTGSGWQIHHDSTVSVYDCGFSIEAQICNAEFSNASSDYETVTASYEWGSASEFTREYWPHPEILGVALFEQSGGWESAEQEEQFRRKVMQSQVIE